MSRYLHIFSSMEEFNAFKNILSDPCNEFVIANPAEYSSPENLLVFTAPGPIVSLPKKADYRKVTESDFRFNHDDVFTQQFLDNDIGRVFLFAPHNHDGMIWLSQWWHVLDQDQTQTKPYQGLSNYYMTYVGGISDIHESGLSSSYLESTFRYHVLSTVTAGLFYKYLSKPLAGKIFGSKKSALSLGMYRMLGAFSVFDNPRCLQATTPNLDRNGKPIGSYIFDSMDSVPVPYHCRTKHAHVPDDNLIESNGNIVLKLNLFKDEPVKLSFPDGNVLAQGDNTNNFQVITAPKLPGRDLSNFPDHLDPYITCLVHGINIRYYMDLVHSGILTTAASPLLYQHQRSKLLQDKFMQYLDTQIKAGILIGRESNDFRLAWKNNFIAPNHDTLVLETVPEWITKSFEYSILYERYHASTLLRYCQLPVMDTFQATATVNDIAGVGLFNINIRTSRFACVNTSTVEHFNWLCLLDESMVLKLPINNPSVNPGNGETFSVPATTEVIDSPLPLAHIFNVLESAFGQKPSYNYQLIRTLTRRGYLMQSMNGYRITGYGYAVYKAMESGLGSGLDELDALQFRWNQYWLDTIISSSVPIDSEFVSALELVRKLVDSATDSVEKWKRYRVTKKRTVTVKNSKNSAKPFTTKTCKRVYRLVVDRKHKAAWFECKGKIVPVHAYVKQSQMERFGAATESSTFHTSKLVPQPKSVLKHARVFENPCCHCSGRLYKYIVVGGHGSVHLQCTGCGTVSVDPAPFLVLNNNTNKASDTDGDTKRKTILSLDDGGVIGVHPNAIGAAQVAQHIRNQLGTGSVAQGILKDFDSKVQIADLDSLLDDI